MANLREFSIQTEAQVKVEYCRGPTCVNRNLPTGVTLSSSATSAKKAAIRKKLRQQDSQVSPSFSIGFNIC